MRKKRSTYNDPVVINPNDEGFSTPQDLDLEKVILGSALLERTAQKAAIELLQPSDFYNPEHNVLFDVMQQLDKAGEPITMRTIVGELRKANKLEQCGGAVYIVELTAGVTNTIDIRNNCLVLKELSIKRKVIALAATYKRKAYLDDTDAVLLLQELTKAIDEVNRNSAPPQIGTTMKVGVHRLIENIQIRKHTDSGYTGVPSGFPKIDAITKGWQKTDLIIIAARPGMGKTAFIVSALRNAAVDYKKPVAIFSLEMATQQLVGRIVSAETEITLEDVRHKVFEDHDWAQLSHRTNRLVNAPIFIDDTPAITITELRAKSARLVADHGVELIVIDYLQLMRGEGDEGNREQEVSYISSALKSMAKSLNVPVIALSQLSRSVEARGGTKFPMLSDLRESGSIEQDADMVVFLWRPEYYAKNDKNEHFRRDSIGEFIPGVTMVDFAKFRNGDPDKCAIKFIGKYTKFVHVDSPYEHLQEYNREIKPVDPDLFSESRKEEPTAIPDNGDIPF